MSSGHGCWPWPQAMTLAMAMAMGHSHWPWPVVIDGGHGWWPIRVAMVISHGHLPEPWLLPRAMAPGHGPLPWRLTMASSHGHWPRSLTMVTGHAPMATLATGRVQWPDQRRWRLVKASFDMAQRLQCPPPPPLSYHRCAPARTPPTRPHPLRCIATLKVQCGIDHH